MHATFSSLVTLLILPCLCTARTLNPKQGFRALCLWYFLHTGGVGSSVSAVTRLQAGRTWNRGFDIQHGETSFLFTSACRPAVGLTQPPIQSVLGLSSHLRP